jgi:hypothetical protein
MRRITAADLDGLPFRVYRKTALLRARLLTQEDFDRRGGVVQTLEGPVRFEPGDYLARGVQNEEWPIRRDQFEQLYRPAGNAGADGFGAYHAIGVREAVQIDEPFTVQIGQGDVLTGKPGDYLVKSDGGGYVAERDIFESTYEPAG